MTTAKTKATAGAAEAAADAFSSVQNLEIPAIFRDVADRTVSQAKDVYSRTRAAAEEATDMIENAYESTRQSVRSMSLKALEAAQVHADASFALFKDLFGAKTFADAMEVQTAFARRQMDTAVAQMKDFQEVAQKAFMDAAKPAQDAMTKTFASATRAAAA